MKKILALLLVLVMVLALCACGEAKTEEPKEEEPAPEEEVVVEETPEEETAEEPAEETAEEPVEEEPASLSHEEFLAEEDGMQVTVLTYVQANESWWDNKITLHAQGPDGAYYLYNVECTEEDAAKLVPGTPILVTGDKATWNGLVEIQDCTFEFVDAEPWIAEPFDFAAVAAEGKLEEHMNELFTLNEGVIVDKGEGNAFFFNWDNSGEDGNCDLYFDVEVNGETYTFVVRRYLTAPGSEVYEAVKGLQIGDTVEISGFLYWYEGPQPHITSIAVK